jgi:hypothetical protein
MCVQLKIHQRIGEGESKSKFERCRACNAQTIFDVIGAEAKGVKALTHMQTPRRLNFILIHTKRTQQEQKPEETRLPSSPIQNEHYLKHTCPKKDVMPKVPPSPQTKSIEGAP